jgi:hypothetical protein
VSKVVDGANTIGNLPKGSFFSIGVEAWGVYNKVGFISNSGLVELEGLGY